MSKDIALLKDLCDDFKKDIVDGPFGSNLKREHFVEEGIPVIKIQNIKPFLIIPKNLSYVTSEKYEELKRHSYKQGDIVMTKLGNPLGASAIVENINDGLIVADTVRIRAEKINTKYLCYHLNSPITQDLINSQQKGATRPRVKIANVRELPIYAPKEEQQKQIVEILDKVFESIDKAKENIEKNIENSKELFQSRLNEIFSQKGEDWEEKKFKNCLKLKSGDGLTSKNMIQSGSYHVYGGNGVTGNHNNFNLEGEHIIIGRVGANCGNVRLIKEKIWLTDNAFQVSEMYVDFYKPFLVYLLNYKNLRQYARQAAQPVVSNSSIKDVVLVYPTNATIQKQIVHELDSLKEQTKQLEKYYQQKLQNLEELKKSVLQKAFSGELV
ncbi:restriction endonuclease subunit S [Sulfurimonas microaerophilic]|uniref:restriction endonuclease subunit S n=1 Tax=Sulfurimonas microaerophilic TaxID=3058392 RepID=UPI00271512E6|nr:restriction endonuclease subunit S [Sulfurimonas sp. hsl 1-7]